MKIKDLCAEERPREKMLAKGASEMSNAELLAILIGSGTRKGNVLEVANKLLSRNEGKLSGIARMSPQEMKTLDGIGVTRYTAIAAALELGKRCCLEDPGMDNKHLVSAHDVYRMMIPHLKGLKHEECWGIFLNRANRIISKERFSIGGSVSTIVDAKLVVKKALDRHASALILVHNHPSGEPRPGSSDIEQTRQLKNAANTFDISLLDHVIVCDDRFFSFADDRTAVVGKIFADEQINR